MKVKEKMKSFYLNKKGSFYLENMATWLSHHARRGYKAQLVD